MNEDTLDPRDFEQEDTKTRHLTYKSREFILKCSDPYGFWTIQPKDGPAPLVLSGDYTSFWEAERAIEAYINAITFKANEIEVKRNAKKEARLNDSPS